MMMMKKTKMMVNNDGRRWVAADSQVVPAEEGGVGGEDAGELDVPNAGDDEAHGGLPLVEVGDETDVAVDLGELPDQQRRLVNTTPHDTRHAPHT